MKKVTLFLIAILSCISMILVNGCSNNSNNEKIVGTYYAKVSSTTMGNYLQEVIITKEKDSYYLEAANWMYELNTKTDTYEPNRYPMQKQEIQIKDNKFTATTYINTKTVYDIKENTITGLRLDNPDKTLTYKKSTDVPQEFIKEAETEHQKEQDIQNSRFPNRKAFSIDSSKLQSTLKTK